MADGLNLARTDDRDGWNAIVHAAPHAVPYQRWEWCAAQETIGDGASFQPCLAELDSEAYAVPVFRTEDAVQLSHFGYGTICGPHTERVRFAELEAAIVELFGLPVRKALLPPGVVLADVHPGEGGWAAEATYTIDLPADFETLWTAAKKRARHNVRYSDKQGLTIDELAADAWPQVADMENAMLARKGVDFRFPLDFWLSVENSFGADELLKLGAFHDGALVGAGIFLNWRDTSYHLISASTEAGRQLGSGHALCSAGLERACAAGLASADLGPAPDPELAHSKRIWGAVPRQYLAYRPNPPSAPARRRPSSGQPR